MTLGCPAHVAVSFRTKAQVRVNPAHPELHLSILPSAHEPIAGLSSEHDSIHRAIVLVLELVCQEGQMKSSSMVRG